MKTINRKSVIKNIIVVTLPLIFFFIMIFITYSVSDNMYNNVTLKLLHRQTKAIEETIKQQSKDSINISYLIDFPIVYINIYSSKKELLFSFGDNRFLSILSSVQQEGKEQKIYKSKDNHLYYVESLKIDLESRIYCNIVYDFTKIKISLFKNGRMILLLIFIFTLTIIYFLFILIFAYQKRINATKRTIKSITNIDNTTGFYLSKYFFDLLEKEVERCFRTNNEFTLLICAIDKFHRIGELYSEEFSDQILNKISKIIKNNFRNFDIIGRTGEDEISIVMVNSDDKDGYKAAIRCNDHIKENKFYFDGMEITFSLKVGIASSKLYKNSFDEYSIENNQKVDTKERTREIVLKALDALSKAKKSDEDAIEIYK